MVNDFKGLCLCFMCASDFCNVIRVLMDFFSKLDIADSAHLGKFYSRVTGKFMVTLR